MKEEGTAPAEQTAQEQVTPRTIQAAPGDSASARPVGEPADRTKTTQS